MKTAQAAARLLVVLAAVWGGSFLVQSPASAGYYSGEAAKAFLKAQDQKRREEAPVVIYEAPAEAGYYLPGAPPASSFSASFGGSSWWGGRALAPPYVGSVRSAGGASLGLGGFSATYGGASGAYRSGLSTRWVYGPRVPSHFYFSNRGLLSWGTGRFAMRIGW